MNLRLPTRRDLYHAAFRATDASRKLIGIRNTMQLTKAVNTAVHGRYLSHRQQLCREQLDALLHENVWRTRHVNRIRDGYALDTSRSLPHLDALLEASDAIIAERGGTLTPDTSYRAFFRHLTTVDDLARFPVLLDFITSSEVLATACAYLGFVPCLSKELPPGVRFVESSSEYDALRHSPPRDSQLIHMDPYDTPEVYVIVALRDIGPENGPFCFFTEQVSQQAAAKLDYWRRGTPFRLSDETFYGVVPQSARIDFTVPRGTVLFIDPSRCFHFGSRNCEKPRYMLMYSLASPCRSDLSETLGSHYEYPIETGASRLRRLVLDRTHRL